MTIRNLTKQSITLVSLLVFLVGCFSVAYVDPVEPDPSTAQLIGDSIQVVPTTTRSLPEDCDSEGNPAAYYVGASLYMKVQSLAQTSNKRIVASSRILSYDPYESFADVTFPRISNIVPHKTSIPVANKKVIVADIDPISKVQMPDASYQRGALAGQLVSNMHYQGISTTSTSNLITYIYQILNETSTRTIALNSNMLIPSIDQTYVCFDYYVAYCGDGVTDNADGGDGDGREGIKNENNDIIPWSEFGLSTKTPNEVCDDGGAPGGCKDDCTGTEGPTNPTCPSNQAVTPTIGQAGTASTFSFTWTPNTTYTTISFAGPGVTNGSLGVTSSSTSLTYTPVSAGNLQYNLVLTNANGSTTCPFPAVAVGGTTVACGNGVLEGTEQCDDGNTINTDACKNDCTLAIPTCTLQGTPNPVYASMPIVFTATKPSWATYLTFTAGGVPVSILANPTFPLTRVYYTPGTYVAKVTVGNGYAGPINTTLAPAPETSPTATKEEMQEMQERGTTIAGPSGSAPSSWQQVSEEEMMRDPGMPVAATNPSCIARIRVLPACTITFNEPFINPGEVVAVSWQVHIPFFKPAYITANPTVLGSWPTTVMYATGTSWAQPMHTGMYTFSFSGLSLSGYHFSCSATLPVGLISGTLLVDKTITTTGTYAVGDLVGFKIHFKNTTPYTLSGVTVKDILPRSLDYVSSKLVGATATSSGVWEEYGYRVAAYSGIILTPNQQGDLYLTGRVRANAQYGQSTNVALVYDSHFSGSDAIYVDLGPKLFLKVYQSINGGAFTEDERQTQIGDTIVYKLVFGNSGAISTSGGVKLRNYLPKGIAYVSSSISIPGVVISTGDVVDPVILVTGMLYDLDDSPAPIQDLQMSQLAMNAVPVQPEEVQALSLKQKTVLSIVPKTIQTPIVGALSSVFFLSTVSDMYVHFANFNLAGGQGGYAIITGIVTPAYQYDRYFNKGFISTTTPYRTASDYVIAYRNGAVSISKTAVGGSSYYLGDPLDFVITLTNYSTGTLTNVSVQDTWPNAACIMYSGRALATGEFTSPSAMIWNYSGTIAPGASVAFHVYGTIATAAVCSGTYTNIATSTYQGLGNGTTSTQFDFTVLERPFATIELTKQADMAKAMQGETITYTISYKNVGNTTINSYTILDQFPGTLDFVSATPAPNSNTATTYGRALQWNFSTPLAPSATGTITVKGTVR